MMALIKTLTEKSTERTSVHTVATASFHVFEKDGQSYLQIDSYGSAVRQLTDKVSQSIQFGPEGLAELRRVLREVP